MMVFGKEGVMSVQNAKIDIQPTNFSKKGLILRIYVYMCQFIKQNAKADLKAKWNKQW
jgi:hypothetical protein